ncbi:MAG TPA: alpha/beta fold hydrolase [Acidimicrobiales bacterium]
MTPTDPAVLPGAEAWSAPGGPHGALVLHGFTGNPTSMRPLAERLAAAGLAVELPRLPGHGTTVEDMATTSWPDWSAAAEAAYADLAARCERVVVAGLSMGGTLAAWLAVEHPEVAGLVLVNPAVEPIPPMRDLVEAVAAQGEAFMPGVGSDIAAPGVIESAYDRAPVAGLLSLLDAVDALQPRLPGIRCPILLATSPHDHVVPPTGGDHLAGLVAGPVTRLVLERSFHVATLDLDRELLEDAAVRFAGEVTGG